MAYWGNHFKIPNWLDFFLFLSLICFKKVILVVTSTRENWEEKFEGAHFTGKSWRTDGYAGPQSVPVGVFLKPSILIWKITWFGIKARAFLYWKQMSRGWRNVSVSKGSTCFVISRTRVCLEVYARTCMYAHAHSHWIVFSLHLFLGTFWRSVSNKLTLIPFCHSLTLPSPVF